MRIIKNKELKSSGEVDHCSCESQGSSVDPVRSPAKNATKTSSPSRGASIPKNARQHPCEDQTRVASILGSTRHQRREDQDKAAGAAIISKKRARQGATDDPTSRASTGGPDWLRCDDHERDVGAATTTIIEDQVWIEDHRSNVLDDVGDKNQTTFEDYRPRVLVPDSRFDGTGPLGPAVAELVRLYRLYKRYEVSRIRQSNQGFALVYSETDATLPKEKRAKIAGAAYARIQAGKPLPEEDDLARCCVPFLMAAEQFDKPMGALDLDMRRAVRRLPARVRDFAASVRGFSEFSLAKLIGLAGDPGTYRTALGLRKRCALAPMYDKAASTWRREGGLSATDWEDLGYSPRRRSAVYVIAEKIASGGAVQAQRLARGEDIDARNDLTKYQKLYQHRLRYEAARDPAHLRENKKEPEKESYSAHAALRAQRFMMQKFLVDLYAVCKEE